MRRLLPCALAALAGAAAVAPPAGAAPRGPLPRDSYVEDATFVTAAHAWVLSSAPCATATTARRC